MDSLALHAQKKIYAGVGGHAGWILTALHLGRLESCFWSLQHRGDANASILQSLCLKQVPQLPKRVKSQPLCAPHQGWRASLPKLGRSSPITRKSRFMSLARHSRGSKSMPLCEARDHVGLGAALRNSPQAQPAAGALSPSFPDNSSCLSAPEGTGEGAGTPPRHHCSEMWQEHLSGGTCHGVQRHRQAKV